MHFLTTLVAVAAAISTTLAVATPPLEARGTITKNCNGQLYHPSDVCTLPSSGVWVLDGFLADSLCFTSTPATRPMGTPSVLSSAVLYTNHVDILRRSPAMTPTQYVTPWVQAEIHYGFFLTTVSSSTYVSIIVFAPRLPLSGVVMLVTMAENTIVKIMSWCRSKLDGGHFDGGYDVNWSWIGLWKSFILGLLSCLLLELFFFFMVDYGPRWHYNSFEPR